MPLSISILGLSLHPRLHDWLLVLAALTAAVLALRLILRERVLSERLGELLLLQEEKRTFYDFLHNVGEALGAEPDRRELVRLILNAALRVTTARSGILYLPDSGGETLCAAAIDGSFPPLGPLDPAVASRLGANRDFLKNHLLRETIPVDSAHPIATVFRSCSPLRVPQDLPLDRFPNHQQPALTLTSLMVHPLIFCGKSHGVIALANRPGDAPFTRTHSEIIRSVAEQAAFALHCVFLIEQGAAQRLLQEDLATARQVQRTLLPETCPDIPGYLLAALNRPALTVSGDYYDFIRVDDSRLGMVVADVSGKGISAALVMTMCRTLMHAYAPGNASPADVLRHVNRILHSTMLENMFVTMIYAILDHQNHILTLAKAGHDAPLHFSQVNQSVLPLKSPGMALGIDSGPVFDGVLQDLVIPLQTGDTLLAYTDGVSEALDSKGQQFGRDQLCTLVKSAAPKGPTFLSMNILERITRFRGDTPQNDDITLIALKRK